MLGNTDRRPFYGSVFANSQRFAPVSDPGDPEQSEKKVLSFWMGPPIFPPVYGGVDERPLKKTLAATPKMCGHQVSAAQRLFMFRGNLASLCFPRAAIVQLVIAGADWKLALRSRPELVSTAKPGCALVEAILVGATMP